MSIRKVRNYRDSSGVFHRECWIISERGKDIVVEHDSREAFDTYIKACEL